ncbi:hypothetical protein K1T71_010651 [Dendrolimus kikuchii]|uniref:Uncharacterized protein n=1 Tax=Dendrolimus kikuchii TaxID=765133 RepID=A0ACC1CPV5_9NEOP|nr:hypothetical protein K1T71_010651 [Dendrolimus kikuchii]
MIYSIFFGFMILNVESVVLNDTCPVVKSRELDWKALDGTWYIAAIATELPIQGDCAMLLFDHENTTDIYISSITNNTVTYYNGSVALTPDPNSNTTGDLLSITYDVDHRIESYSFLDINYEHYAVVFTCYNNEDGTSSTYEIWKLTRSPHLKAMDAVKLDQAVADYNLQHTSFTVFNNTEDTCRINRGTHLDTSSLIMTSAAAITLLRRMF